MKVPEGVTIPETLSHAKNQLFKLLEFYLAQDPPAASCYLREEDTAYEADVPEGKRDAIYVAGGTLLTAEWKVQNSICSWDKAALGMTKDRGYTCTNKHLNHIIVKKKGCRDRYLWHLKGMFPFIHYSYRRFTPLLQQDDLVGAMSRCKSAPRIKTGPKRPYKKKKVIHVCYL